jgi:DNA (cytosine-5)-methyltransferase 1
MKAIIRRKLRRLRDGHPARVLDLFAGCGGMSLGAHLAGCRILGGLELDPKAARSHAHNFHSELGPGELESHARPRDITKEDPLDLVRELVPRTRNPQSQIDLLVGGPPCQSFARVGRAKLREIKAHPEAFLHDERSGLYRHYLRFVEALSPIALVVENVPDVLNYGGLNIFDTIAAALRDCGYECAYGLLNAAHYGVPQMRTRCFLVGVHREAATLPTLPPPTHRHHLPVGYRGTKEVALRNLTLFADSFYVEIPEADSGAPPAVSAQDALGDLPVISEHLRGELKKAARRFDTPVRLPALRRITSYAEMMRTWPGFESDGYVYDHVIRYLPRDYKIFARMQPGDQYPEAYALAQKMRDAAVRRVESERGTSLSRNSAKYRELTTFFVPPYDPGKFPNKWRKMEADQPARTLMAHIGKDTYSHIHYDSQQARTISVREAARLQSFPDGFRFCGTMNPAFRQIGNAVPPLLAYAVTAQILDVLNTGCTSSFAADVILQQPRNAGLPGESIASSG